jgi:hypothetical protein
VHPAPFRPARNQNKVVGRARMVALGLPFRKKEVAKNAGLSKDQQTRATCVANVAPEEFETACRVYKRACTIPLIKRRDVVAVISIGVLPNMARARLRLRSHRRQCAERRSTDGPDRGFCRVYKKTPARQSRPCSISDPRQKYNELRGIRCLGS